MKAYYNEHDPKAAAWLRQLMKNGNITPGEVDERSITEVQPSDIAGFKRVHFFAGIGTWDYCLNQSGWGDRQIWTASLPCQPFSVAGNGLGKDDERHLLPHFLELVAKCKPDVIFGEQVATAIAHGWLDDLQTTMEAENYAIGHCVLGAHSIGAPHIRQRLYWLADRNIKGLQGREGAERSDQFSSGQNGVARWMGNASIATGERDTGRFHSQKEGVCGEGISDGDLCFGSSDASEIERMADSAIAARERTKQRNNGEPYGREFNDIEWIYCRDNKYRPIKSSIQPLVDGTAGRVVHSSDTSTPINANETQEARVMRLKGYGNAIQAQTAIAFIRAYMAVI